MVRRHATDAPPDPEEGYDARLRGLEMRMVVVEMQQRASQTARGKRWQVWLLVVGAVASAIVGAVAGVLKFASATKEESAIRAATTAAFVVASAQPSTSDTFTAGAASGAAKALADFQRQLEEKDMVIVPRSVVRAKPKH